MLSHITPWGISVLPGPVVMFDFLKIKHNDKYTNLSLDNLVIAGLYIP